MPVGAIAALFFFTMRQIVRDAKFWGVAAVFLLPCALTLTIRRFAPPVTSLEQPWRLYHGLFQFMFLMGLLPLSCMIHGTALVGADAESRTIGYLITRRLRRRTVLLTKYFATALVLVPLGCASVFALHASVVTGMDLASLAGRSPGLPDWNPAHDLTVYLYITALGVFGFLAIFGVIGLLTAKPLALSVTYFAMFELFISNLPVGARQYSLTHHLRVTAVVKIPHLTRLFDLPGDLARQLFPADGSGVAEVLIVAAAAMIFASVLVSIRELTPSKVARD